MNDMTTIRAVMTAVMFAVFIAIVLWAYSGRRKAAFEEAARLPLDEDDVAVGENKRLQK